MNTRLAVYFLLQIEIMSRLEKVNILILKNYNTIENVGSTDFKNLDKYLIHYLS